MSDARSIGSEDGRVEPVLLTVPETARVLRIGRNTCYELIRQGRIPHVRLGRVIRVPRHALLNWLGQPSYNADGSVVHFLPSQQH